MSGQRESEAARYRESCRKAFWRQVFREEAAYLAARLKGFPEILSVGCGPAGVEAELIRLGFSVTGLDVSRETLEGAPDGAPGQSPGYQLQSSLPLLGDIPGATIPHSPPNKLGVPGGGDGLRAVVGRAEELPFSQEAFDAVIFVASLQFVDDYRQAVAEAWRVLRPGGRMIALLLNPESPFFKAKRADADSYVNKIQYAGVQGIEEAMKEKFQTRGEYFLSLQDGQVGESQDPALAALYVLAGEKPGGN